jgi:hypothetical protein
VAIRLAVRVAMRMAMRAVAACSLTSKCTSSQEHPLRKLDRWHILENLGTWLYFSTIQTEWLMRSIIHCPENIRSSHEKLANLDNVEVDILYQRGAFLLPPRALCDELVDSYFKWVAPIIPVVNRTQFMRQYRDAINPPSCLLLQAILLAGSTVCSNTQLMDAKGSTTSASLTFYRRAKVHYDADYEGNRVTIVQALVLIGWYWDGP